MIFLIALILGCVILAVIICGRRASKKMDDVLINTRRKRAERDLFNAREVQ